MGGKGAGRGGSCELSCELMSDSLAGGNFYLNSVVDERLEKRRAEEEDRKNDR